MNKDSKNKEMRVTQGYTEPFSILHGDSVQILKTIPAQSVDLVVTSPPYFMGKEYDRSKRVEDFVLLHEQLIPEIMRVTKENASICWQVGYHVRTGGEVVPLDYHIYSVFSRPEFGLTLRNRVIWTFGHGLNTSHRFSGRHETVLWFSKGKTPEFALDRVRVPQKYPGKLHYKGIKKGQHSGNPLGKNPGDVWDIPNVKANHIEKTDHPCQFPVALVQRLVKALCPAGGMVLDPFAGSGSTGVAALVEGMQFIGVEMSDEYADIATRRCRSALNGQEPYRPLDRPTHQPKPTDKVAIRPPWFSDSG